jgi:N-acetylmuramoyl-L-alanine amidase
MGLSLELTALTDNYLRQTSLKHNQLHLLFKYKLSKVHHFTIPKGNGIVKHIYDIQNVALPSTKDISQFKSRGVKAFRIGQYSKKVVRVVIEAKAKMRGKFKIEGRRLILFLPHAKQRKEVKSKLKKSVAKRIIRNNFCQKRFRGKYHYNSARRYKTIVLDAGHGGRDIGASSRWVREKDLTLAMTLKLRDILTQMGYRVLMTRTRDRFMNLKQRTDYVFYRKGSIFISIHANAAPKKRTKAVRYEGIEVFYLGLENSDRVRNKRAVYRGHVVYSRRDYLKMVSPWKYAQSRKLAKSVHRHILSHVSRYYKIYDKGIKRRDFWVLLATKMPSILVETGYLSSEREVKKLKNPNYQIRLMEGIARGINAYYGLY